jgi:hypothetical protein
MSAPPSVETAVKPRRLRKKKRNVFAWPLFSQEGVVRYTADATVTRPPRFWCVVVRLVVCRSGGVS